MAINFLQLGAIDWILIIFVMLGVLLGITRGIGKVSISLLIWSISLISSQIIATTLSTPLGSYINDSELLLLLPFSISFFFIMIVLSLLFSFLSINAGTSPLVRLLGALASLPLIAVQLLVAVNFSRLLTIDESIYWLESEIIPLILQIEYYWQSIILNNFCSFFPGVSCQYF